jgi:hypothetical protein
LLSLFIRVYFPYWNSAKWVAPFCVSKVPGRDMIGDSFNHSRIKRDNKHHKIKILKKNQRRPETVKILNHPTHNIKKQDTYIQQEIRRTQNSRTQKKRNRKTTIFQRHSSIRHSHILILIFLTTILTLKN